MTEKLTINVGQLCQMHLYDLVRTQLHLAPTDPWQSTVIITQILMFSRIMCDPLVREKVGDDMARLNGLIAKSRCMACLAPDIYKRAVQVMKKGTMHAAAVSRFEVEDPAFPNDVYGPKDGVRPDFP